MTPGPHRDAVDVSDWLAGLAGEEKPDADRVVLTGVLVGAAGDRVQIVPDRVLIELDRGDIASAVERPAPPGTPDDTLVPVLVTLAPGAGIRAARPLAPPDRRRPFALASRPTTAWTVESPRFRALERRYLTEHGLAPALDPGHPSSP